MVPGRSSRLQSGPEYNGPSQIERTIPAKTATYFNIPGGSVCSRGGVYHDQLLVEVSSHPPPRPAAVLGRLDGGSSQPPSDPLAKPRQAGGWLIPIPLGPPVKLAT